jgi:hypothetical protein
MRNDELEIIPCKIKIIETNPEIRATMFTKATPRGNDG